MNKLTEDRLMRRVQGYHDIRMDGLTDLVMRAKDARVMDIGCNRGLVGFEFANNGAKLVHGCDEYADGIMTARHLFCDMRHVDSRFDVVDLTKGPAALAPFGKQEYDITVMLATYHKIKRAMEPAKLTELVQHFGRRTTKFFAWRGTSDKRDENEQEMRNLDRDLLVIGMKRVHTSYISLQLDLAAIWARY